VKKKIACVDLFCGAGGLTHGFILEGLPVVAGIDLDPACRFPYEENNGQARFVERDISVVTVDEIKSLFGDADLKILAGCAPCQKIEAVCDALGYKKKARVQNMAHLGTLVSIRKA
jgi:DNA (cytosine-5)-methyltransferase 1